MSRNFGRPENPSECMGQVEEITKHQVGSEIRKPLSEGIYVRGSLNDLPILFTADTGASRTIISSKVYSRLDPTQRPVLQGGTCLKGASGAPIRECGRARFTLKLGSLELPADAIVADIEDEALLGCDVLNGSEKGPADILLSKGMIVLDDTEIPCFRVGTKKTRRVTLADDVSVPGRSEALVDVFLERVEDDDVDPHCDYIVEPTEKFKERYPLVMASTLVDINRSPTCKIRVLNPYSTEVALRQDAEVATAEKIDRIVTTIVEEECEKEKENLSTIKRVTCQQQTEIDVRGFSKSSKDGIPEHLGDLFNRSVDNKTEVERQMIAALLTKHADTFSRDEWDIGLTDLSEHSIDTGDARPIKQRPRRVPLAFAEEEKKAIEDLLKKGVIQKSTSPWASPIVLVRKKSGAIRPCVDYRKINALVKPDGFPLPRIQDCLDAMTGSQYFSSFDLTSGYFQIPLKKTDVPKSAFACKYGLFEMKRMPFGLNNAASTCQRTLELALQGLQWITCLIYIDDIIVFGATLDEHVSRVDEVLERIKAAGLKLKPEKCNLLQNEVVFLGHVVSGKGVLPDPCNVAKILQWPKPCTSKQVKQFVATGSYYRRFVKNFAKIARPLIDLTKSGQPFVWDSGCENAFNQIKQALVSPEIMGYPRSEGGWFLLDVDASGVGIGGVLAQEQEGRERVIAYGSRTLNKAERNYCVTEKELLAVVYFTQYFRQYLLGRKFRVRTDHQALVWLFSLKEPSGKIARWVEILAQFDMEIEYRPGKKQAHCDALSRCMNPRDCQCDEVDMFEPLKCGPCRKCRRRAEQMVAEQREICRTGTREDGLSKLQSEKARAVTTRLQGLCTSPDNLSQQQTQGAEGWLWLCSAKEIATLQEKDPDIKPIMSALLSSQKPSSEQVTTYSPATRHYLVMWDNLHVERGVVYKVFQKQNGCGQFRQLVVPRSLKEEVMRQMHDTVMAGHLGVKKTKEKLKQRYYWFNMSEDIGLYIKGCDTCAADKKPQKKPRAPLGHLAAGAPWDTLAIDYMGPFPETPRGNRYIMVLTDHFTKYVEIIAVPNQHAEECANKIVNDFVARWGAPLTIHSDQGPTFESKVFKKMCQILGVRKTRSSPRNPKGNGQTERFNRTLLRMIRAFLTGEQEDWDLYLGCLACAYRATPNETTRLSPNLLALGREIRLPSDLVYNYPLEKCPLNVSAVDHVEDLKDRMLHAHDVAREYLKQGTKRSKAIYDSKMLLHNYQIGDAIWCLHETKKPGVAPKLQRQFDGPFLIKAKLSPVNFLVQFARKGPEKVLHHDKLKPYEGTNLPGWILNLKKKLHKKP